MHILNQDGGQKSQQISAAIIKKIQNNYQVSVNTSSYDNEQRKLRDTESAEALQATQIKLQSDKSPSLKYLHALHEIIEIYPDNAELASLLRRVHSGMSNVLLNKEEKIQDIQ